MLKIVLHHLPELEAIGGVEVKGAKGLADSTNLGRFKSHVLVHQVLSNASQDVWRPVG